MTLKIKRVYEPFSSDDGVRILVERLWPRGVSKESAHIELWLRAVSPSDELRKWFNHSDEKWPEFKKRYAEELKKSGALEELQIIIKDKSNVTLIYSARNETYNNAVALLEMISK